MRGAIGLILAGLVCYIGSAVLTWYYLEKRMPGLLQRSAELPPDADGRLLWERTAGTGTVPRWVSLIGLLALPAIVLGVLGLIVGWLR